MFVLVVVCNFMIHDIINITVLRSGVAVSLNSVSWIEQFWIYIFCKITCLKEVRLIYFMKVCDNAICNNLQQTYQPDWKISLFLAKCTRRATDLVSKFCH